MYKVPLAVVCLAAATSAIKLSTDQGCCCHMMPCMPTCTDMCNDDDHQHDDESPLDPLIEDISEEAEPIIDDIMDDIEKEVNDQVEDPEDAADVIDEIEDQVTEDVIDDVIKDELTPPTTPEEGTEEVNEDVPEKILQAKLWLEQYDFKDMVSSYTCGKHVAYDLCNDDGQAYSNRAAGAISQPLVEFHYKYKVNFISLWPYDPAQKAAVTFYQLPGCRHEHSVQWDEGDQEVKLHEQRYRWNPSSLMLPYGYSVDLFSLDMTKSLTVDGPEYLDDHDHMECVSLYPHFDNITQKYRIYRTGEL